MKLSMPPDFTKQPEVLGQFQFNKFVKALYGLNPNRVGNLTLLAR